ncbi:MAG: metal-dependent hydrolase [Segniliparus sp.]|uniref:metal-dependent hydrolase n=1 Tax=Segniliparus sp. TaxID=2804064 RepID=UPI003F3BF956
MAVEPFAAAGGAPDAFAPEEIALHARDVHFDFSKARLSWIEGDPYGSHFITALNLFLPTGERWFCKVFTDALEYVKDERIREEAIGFMGQEAVHAKSHDKAVVQFLARHGVDCAPFLHQVEWVAQRLSERIDQADPGRRAKAVQAATALVASIEHFTAVLGDWVLNNQWNELDVDPAMADLFRWHGAEEVEHRHVAHNLATYLGMGYFQRAYMSVIASVGFLTIILRGTKFLVHNDPALPNLGYCRLFWRLRDSWRGGSIPRVGFLLRSAFRLLRWHYTTDTEGNTAQAVAYLAVSPAARVSHG